MEPIFTIPYPEYVVAEELQRYFKKNYNYSVFIPSSRQHKAVDLLLVKHSEFKTVSVSIQVKSSKIWLTNKQTKKQESYGLKVKYGLWFKKFRFLESFESKEPTADFFIFIGLKPVDEGETKKKTKSAWEPVMLMFDREELKMFFDRLTEDNIYFTGDDNGRIYVTRGLSEIEDITRHLFFTKINQLMKAINQDDN